MKDSRFDHKNLKTKINAIRYIIELSLFINSFYIIDTIQRNKFLPFSKQFIKSSLKNSLIIFFPATFIIFILFYFPKVLLRNEDKWNKYNKKSFLFIFILSVIFIIYNNFLYTNEIIPKNIKKKFILIFWFDFLIYTYRYILFKLINLVLKENI